MLFSLLNISYRSLVNRNRKKFGLDPINNCWNHFLGDKVLLACDSEYTTVPSDIKKEVHHTGYLLINQKDDLEPELINFIDSGRPPIYVGFGSMNANDPERTSEIIIGAANLADQRLVLSRGGANLGSKYSENKNCFVVGKTSHTALFSKMSAVIHHGGSGTTATAARAGVPQMIIPHMTDQYYFARHVPDSGVSPKSIWRQKLTPQNLAEAIKEMTTSEEMKKKSKELSVKLSKYDSFGLTEKKLRKYFF